MSSHTVSIPPGHVQFFGRALQRVERPIRVTLSSSSPTSQSKLLSLDADKNPCSVCQGCSSFWISSFAEAQFSSQSSGQKSRRWRGSICKFLKKVRYDQDEQWRVTDQTGAKFPAFGSTCGDKFSSLNDFQEAKWIRTELAVNCVDSELLVQNKWFCSDLAPVCVWRLSWESNYWPLFLSFASDTSHKEGQAGETRRSKRLRLSL